MGVIVGNSASVGASRLFTFVMVLLVGMGEVMVL